MSALNQIINISTRLEAVSPVVRSFGTILIVSPGAPYTGGKLYANSPSGRQAMLDDGWTTGSVAYQKAVVLGLQNPAPREFIAYGRATNSGGALSPQSILMELATNTDLLPYRFSVFVNGAETAIDYTPTDTADIQGDLNTLLGAITGISSSLAGSDLVLEADTAGDRITFKNLPKLAPVRDITADTANASAVVNQAVADIEEAGLPFWFGLIWDTTSDAEMDAVATAAEASKKHFVGVTTNELSWTDAADLTSAIALNDTANRFHVAYIPSRSNSDHKDIALLGAMYAFTPGAASFANKTLQGVTSDLFSSSELTVIKGFRGIPVATIPGRGLAVTLYGNAPGSDAVGIDMSYTRDIAFTEEQITVQLLSYLVAQPKVPYTEAGIESAINVLRGVLQRGEDLGIFTPGSTSAASAKEFADITSIERQSGELDLVWSGVYATGIKSITVNGVVTLGPQ